MIVNANALHIPLKDKSIQCCVTSPPYWGLRDYGEDDQLGLEQTPEEYVENMVAVFREVWRVLRDDGTLWLNLGDSYYNYRGAKDRPTKQTVANDDRHHISVPTKRNFLVDGLKEKDLVGIPWRVAFALQSDGWYLRNDIIWHKPNPMPESVTDRCTKSHEYIFLLTKNARYYYDNESIKEESENSTVDYSKTHKSGNKRNPTEKISGFRPRETEAIYPKRNKRTVWTITTKPYSGAHYATFPPELPEICIKAGTSEAGKCPDCGTAFERMKEVVSKPDRDTQEVRENMVGVIPGRDGVHRMNSKDMESIVYKDTGWQAQCGCGKDPTPCIVLDPFAGSGTTLMVARNLGRKAVGLDLSYDYLVNNAKQRLGLTALEEWTNGKIVTDNNVKDLPMFT